MSRADSDYLEHDPFFGDEGELTCRNVRQRRHNSTPNPVEIDDVELDC